jgi:uncharacterized protein (TIGR02302 family)
MAGRPETKSQTAPDKLHGLVRRSALALWWERLWPCLWLPLAVALVFLSVSWLGLWLWLPPVGRMVGLGLFGLAFLISLWPLFRLRAPAEPDALARLDRTAPLGHRPASAIRDTLAVGDGDPFAKALWKAHLERQQRDVDALRVATPSPGMVRIDRLALRAAPVVAAVAAFFVAGPEANFRLSSALHWTAPAAPSPQVRIDGWIDPPGYTRLPPIMLSFGGTGEVIRAPVNSTIIVRVSGAPDVTIAADGKLEAMPAPAGIRQGIERRFTVAGDGTVTLGGTSVPASLVSIAMVPDRPPEIDMTETPQAGQRGQLNVVYRARDDYGIASVEAAFRPVTAASRADARPLIEPPRLPLPGVGDASGEADIKTTLELAEHPWAGARVQMTLTARDDAGQEGVSEAREVTLPQRAFNKPLAKALVETRRWLVLDANDRPRAQTALDALMIEPGEYLKEPGAYLGMRLIAEKLRNARGGQRGDPQLLEVVEDLWQLALLLEDGDLSDAERQLRAAQDRLQQAMERGADQQELSRLTQELREAMNRYMREMAEQMQRDQQNGRQNEMSQLPENFRTVTPRDLNNMLNRIDELNKRGETEEAQRLLNELNNMMRNLQQARPGQMDPRQREMQNQLGELDRMTREQQELRDETFQDGQEQRSQQRNQRTNPNQRGQQQQGQRQQGQRQQGQQQRGQQQEGQDGQEGQEGQEGQMGQQGQRGQPSREQLAQRQQQLRDRLRDMQRRMQQQGQQSQPGLGDAEQAMGEAEGALGQGDMNGAAAAQGRALDGLRNGAQQLAQQMQQEGQGEGEGEGMADGDPTQGGRDRAGSRQTQQRDPLGRDGQQRESSRGIISGDTRVPGEAPQVRARRILEELRRRLGETLRPQEELEYLERLLKRQ